MECDLRGAIFDGQNRHNQIEWRVFGRSEDLEPGRRRAGDGMGSSVMSSREVDQALRYRA